MSTVNGGVPQTRSWVLFTALFLMAGCLRAPVTGVGPVLGMLQSDLGLRSSTAGLLVTLPLLMFSLGSLFAAKLARRWGLNGVISVALLVIACGILLRSAGSISLLFLGTGVIGIGIAVGNVLLPSLIKADFPARVAPATSLSGIAMSVVGALASVSVVPLSLQFGWQVGLAAVVLFPLCALAIWRLRAPSAAASGPAERSGGRLWRSPLAWQITLYLGFNSLMFYSMASWLPEILGDAGFSAAVAGTLHGEMQLASALPGLFLGPLMARVRDQKPVAVVMALFMGASLLGLILFPAWAVAWVALFGFGSTGCFLLAIMFMAFRTHSPVQAAALSGMAQFLGYLLAACGPALWGSLHEWGEGWDLPLLAGVGVTLLMAIFGAMSARDRKIAA
ncbi:MFS transporter [Microbulbifer harenosus]|uniref:CynX/NimT family MFS transporter n=1 Tax=Microbulbifer harenosus TaxID=2576840 RepID=A0ABY2UFG8_9GAMM|nr:MFS transporter [Microbulbifer harenosus]TLM75750.1 CynX/NimT family MFS transporter [Microbulbifer harenosus]